MRFCFRIYRTLFALLALQYSNNLYAQASEERLSSVIEHSKRAIVKIHVTGTDAKGGAVNVQGSGFFFQSNQQRSFIVTAKHLIGSNEKDSNLNSDWEVKEGTREIVRNIEVRVFDANGNLYKLSGNIYVAPFAQQDVDLAVLVVDKGPFPVIRIGNPFATKGSNNVVLLGFRGDAEELTKPPSVGIGDIKGLKYSTSARSYKGESGAPLVDLATGTAFGVASGAQTSADDPMNEAELLSPIDAWISTYEQIDRGVVEPIPTPRQEFPDSSRNPIRSEADNAKGRLKKNGGPPEFSGLDLIYFRRRSDEASVLETLRRMNLNWRQQPGQSQDRSNVVTCGSDKGLPAAKMLARALLSSGLEIKGIAPQYTQIADKLTIEYYPEYEYEPILNLQRLDSITTCPDWSNVLSSKISVLNNCPYNYNVYIRYFDTRSNKWITTAKYGLKPREYWVVTDASGLPVGSGKPFVRVISRAYSANNFIGEYNFNDSTINPQGASSSFLNSIPDEYFRQRVPNMEYVCR